MFYCKRIQEGMNKDKKFIVPIFLGILTLCFVLACSKDVVPDPEKEPDPQQQEDPKEDPNSGEPVTTSDPDVLSEYLVMTGANKINGPLSQAADGQLQINLRDTTYAVKGYPIAAPRLLIKKPLGLEIASFNIQVGGASFYYNFAAEKLADDIPMAADSLSVLVFDVQPPDDIALPLTLDIKIQPLDPSGQPLDEFERAVTVEEPNSSHCSPLAPNPCSGEHPINCGGYPNWDWISTLFHFNQAYIYPDVWTLSEPWKAIGCCIGDGESVFEHEDHRCRPDGNNLEYKELAVLGTGSKRNPLRLGLYDDGEFYLTSGIGTRNIDSENMDFCSNLVPYTVYFERGNLGGRHDYQDGAGFINMTFDPAFDTGGYRPFWAGKVLFYTCNTMVIEEPDPEGDFGLEVSHVFRRYKSPETADPNDFGELNPFKIIMEFFY